MSKTTTATALLLLTLALATFAAVYDDNDESWTSADPAENIVFITSDGTETKYTSFYTAFDANKAKTGGTIKLTGDVTEQINATMTVNTGITLTIDLNGFTLNIDMASTDKLHLFTDSGTLIITDSSVIPEENKSGAPVNAGSLLVTNHDNNINSIVCIKATGKLTVENVVMKMTGGAKGSAIWLSETGANVTGITKSQIEAPGYGISNNDIEETSQTAYNCAIGDITYTNIKAGIYALYTLECTIGDITHGNWESAGAGVIVGTRSSCGDIVKMTLTGVRGIYWSFTSSNTIKSVQTCTIYASDTGIKLGSDGTLGGIKDSKIFSKGYALDIGSRITGSVENTTFSTESASLIKVTDSSGTTFTDCVFEKCTDYKNPASTVNIIKNIGTAVIKGTANGNLSLGSDMSLSISKLNDSTTLPLINLTADNNPDAKTVTVFSDDSDNPIILDGGNATAGSPLIIGSSDTIITLGENVILRNNNTTGNGGAVRTDGSLILNGCTITGNTCTSFGGGVYAEGTVTVSGDTVVDGNTVGGAKNNMYLKSGALITVGVMGKLANIGITTETAPINGAPVMISISDADVKQYREHFFSDSVVFAVSVDKDGSLRLALVYSVDSDGAAGGDIAMNGEDYTFRLQSHGPGKYDVTVTIGGNPFTPTDNGNGRYTIAGDRITGNVVITVEFTPQVWIVKFVSGGTTVSETAYTHGTVITPPSNPSKYGCVFVGWNGFHSGMTADGNMTFEAMFTTVPATDSPDTDNGTSTAIIIIAAAAVIVLLLAILEDYRRRD